MMSYSDWMKQQSSKHKTIVTKLLSKNYTKEQIIDYFDFDNMLKEEKNFCELYATNTKCHDIESLNCYLCACPHFRYSDKGLNTTTLNNEETICYSTCSIKHKHGKKFQYANAIHQDCSNCIVPHKVKYIAGNFSLSFDAIMKDTEVI